MALAKFFYPRLVYNAVTIDFAEAYRVIIPPEQMIGSVALSASGLQETLVDRIERTVTLVFWPMTTAKLTEVRTYWTNWGHLGKSGALTLDRLSTCAGQFEYDTYNTFFTAAVLVTNPFAPTRQEAAISRAAYMMSLTWRQDG